jgi:hypothetical protein
VAAKAHVLQSSTSGRQYRYQCPICIYSQGHAEGRFWNGTAIFLEHVATHRGKDIPTEVAHKLNIIHDYVAEERENFDINLFPPGFDRSNSGYGSSDSSLALSRAPTHTSVLDKVWGRKDSTVPHQHHDPPSAPHRTPTFLSLRDRADSVVTDGAERPHVEHSKSEPSK